MAVLGQVWERQQATIERLVEENRALQAEIDRLARRVEVLERERNEDADAHRAAGRAWELERMQLRRERTEALDEIDRLARRVEVATRLASVVRALPFPTQAQRNALAAWDQASREGE